MVRQSVFLSSQKKRYGKRMATCTIFLLVQCSVWAASQADGFRDLTSLPLESLLNMEVQSASKFKQRISEAPSAASVLTSGDIKTYGWRTLADVLNSLPGIHISNDRTYTYLGARGFLRSGDYTPRFLLMIDGHRVNDPLYDQAMMGQEMMLDVDLIDRVEYVPGPGSAIYGSNAFFGVINVITKSGRDFKGVQVSGEAGTAGMRRGRATLGGLSENGVEWLLSATKYNNDGKDLFFPEYNTPAQNNGIARGLDYEKAQSVFAKGSAGPFSIMFAHAEREKGTPTASYSQAFNDPRSSTTDTMSFLDVGYKKALSAKTELSTRVYYNHYKYAGDYVSGSDGSLDFDRSSVSWWGGEAKVVTTHFDRNKLVFGAEYQRNDPIRMRNYSAVPNSDSLNIHTSNQRFGLYAQDEMTLHPDLLLSLGLRYDWNSALNDRDMFNPRLGLIYKLAPKTTAKLLFGKAYRAPNSYELYYNDLATEATQKPSENLRPERIQTSELVLEHQWSANSRVRLSAYINKVKDLIALREDPGDNLLVTQNVGNATAKGLEAEVQHAWNDGTRLRSSLSWQRATDEETGAVLANAPRLLGKLNLSTPFYKNLWRAGLEAQYVSPRNTAASQVGGYALANLTLTSDRLYKGVEVSASIYNLFDHRYANPVGPEFVQDSIVQDGRTFRVKLTYSF